MPAALRQINWRGVGHKRIGAESALPAPLWSMQSFVITTPACLPDQWKIRNRNRVIPGKATRMTTRTMSEATKYMTAL